MTSTGKTLGASPDPAFNRPPYLCKIHPGIRQAFCTDQRSWVKFAHNPLEREGDTSSSMQTPRVRG